MKVLNKVYEFHKTFEAPVLKNPEIPSKERSELRLSLIKEELKELEVAIKENNIIDIADALCDLQYVLSGSVLEFGLGDNFDELFDEVHRSNMSKSCDSEEDAIHTVESYKENGIDCFYKKVYNRWIVYRSDDNKILKSMTYSPVDLKSIIER